MVEGPDPAYWTQYGYAVVNVDQRGVNKSGGDIHVWGSVQTFDAHDVINWIAGQSWSNGKVGLSGVSYYGIEQWFTASQNPPAALAAISPRAHWTNLYGQWMRNGGIYGGLVADVGTEIASATMGEHRTEQFDNMAAADEEKTPYWDDKDVDVSKIKLPVYQVAGPAQSSSMSFPFLPEGNKWLRFAPSYHTDDLYTETALTTERQFFDRFLKGIDNGWERDTPRVRVETTATGTPGPIVKVRQASSWPIENTVYRKLYLSIPDGTLADTAGSTEATTQYDAKTGKVSFTYSFAADADVTGFLKVKLWVKADSIQKDMDVFVNAFKIGGATPVPVGSGQLRASMRELDPQRSTDYFPWPSLKNAKFLNRDEVVPIEFTLHATSMLFKAGDQLRLDIGGNVLALPDTQAVNAGNHTILAGGTRDSFVQIPVAPN